MSVSAVETLGKVLLGAAAISLTLPLGVLSAECLAALLPRRRKPASNERPRPRVSILVPAHNEEFTLPTTLRSLHPQVRPGDRLIVIADNCTDATATVARSFGAEVIERQDAEHRGKGFAMDFGVRHLAADPPDVVVFTDADCLLAPGAVDELALQVGRAGRPAQALYLMEPPQGGKLRDAVSAFAFLLKNQIRPAGLDRLGLHCPLYGTGMAFPYEIVRRMPLADGNIVEDLQLGLNLVCDGTPAGFCQDARVIGQLPDEGTAAMTQRRRWEHGHVRTIFTQAPRMLKISVARRSAVALAAALDLSVPPVSLLAFGVLIGLSGFGAAAALGGWRAPFLLVAAAATLAAICVFAVYLKFGRATLPFKALLGIPAYIAWKVPMYFALVLRPQKQWVQTPRSAAQAKPTLAETPNPSRDPLEPVGAATARNNP